MVPSPAAIPILGALIAYGVSFLLCWKLKVPDEEQDAKEAETLTLRYHPWLPVIANIMLAVLMGLSAFAFPMVAMMPHESVALTFGVTVLLMLLPVFAVLVLLETNLGRVIVSNSIIQKRWVFGTIAIPWVDIKEVRVDIRGVPFTLESLKHGTIWLHGFEGLEQLRELVSQHVVPSRIVYVNDDGGRTSLERKIEASAHQIPSEADSPPSPELLEGLGDGEDVQRKVDPKIYRYAQDMKQL